MIQKLKGIALVLAGCGIISMLLWLFLPGLIPTSTVGWIPGLGSKQILGVNLLHVIVIAAAVAAIVLVCWLLTSFLRLLRALDYSKAITNIRNVVTPGSQLPPEEQHQLEQLAEKFNKGLSRIKAKNRNSARKIFDFPWYVVIGETGSGKTEAIRKSGISLLAGQGRGS